MKKLTSIIITSAILMSNLPALAAQTPSLDFMNTSYLDPGYSNVKQTGTVDFKLNEPIKILDFISDDSSSINNFVNVHELLNTLFDSTISFTSNQIVSEKGKKVIQDASMTSDTYIKINKNLSLAVNQNYEIYADVDFTDAQAPLFDSVISMPLLDKYLVLNNDDLIYEERKQAIINDSYDFYEEPAEEFNEESTEEATSEPTQEISEAITDEITEEVPETTIPRSLEFTSILFDEENIKEINQKVISSIEENAKITGSNSNVTITFSDIGLKKWINDCINIVHEIMDEETKKYYSLSDIPLEDIEKVAKSVPFFDDKALILKYELDDDGRITYNEAELNIDLNVFDIVSALEEDTDGLSKETSNINFTITAKSNISYNTAVVNKPETTEENSISFTQYTDPYGYYSEENVEYDEDYEYFDYYISVEADKNMVSDERHLLPLRNLLESANYTVTYDNGKITAESDSKYAEAKVMIFNLNSTSYSADSTEKYLHTAPFLISDRTYVTLGDAEKIINSTVSYTTYDFLDDYADCTFTRNASEEDFKTVH